MVTCEKVSVKDDLRVPWICGYVAVVNSNDTSPGSLKGLVGFKVCDWMDRL